MKTLSEVIEFKSKFVSTLSSTFYFFIEHAEENFVIRNYDEYIEQETIYPEQLTIFKSYHTFAARDEISFLKEIKPLIVYLCSCVTYYCPHRYDLLKFRLNFNGLDLVLDNRIFTGFYGFFENSIRDMDGIIESIDNKRYCLYFKDDFNLEIFLDNTGPSNILLPIKESKEENYHPENGNKTFKLEQCVICLDNTPNVLFCNCGHLCVCETCNVNEFTKCPVCKKENMVLRII